MGAEEEQECCRAEELGEVNEDVLIPWMQAVESEVAR